jgi:predicted anti-sigma-YlaC factor YlaD
VPGGSRVRPSLAVLTVILLGATASGCSIQRMAVKSMANSLTTGPDVFSSDDDPELVRDAIPFGLKTLESLLETLPRHNGLLLSLCRGYTQYAYAFVQMDAEAIERTDREAANHLRARALKLYLRARGFGLRGLELKHPGISEELERQPEQASAKLTVGELPMLYWTAAAWGSAISVAKDRPDLTADLAAVKALMVRGLALKEDFDGGAIHEAMIVLESLPAAMGGSVDRARDHFRRAVALSKGQRASPYVTLAESVSVMQQNRAEFEQLLRQALAIDPDRSPPTRLETILTQQKARELLAREDELFLDSGAPSDSTR